MEIGIGRGQKEVGKDRRFEYINLLKMCFLLSGAESKEKMQDGAPKNSGGSLLKETGC